MKQLVFRASERLLAFQDKKFFHRNTGKCGEGGRVGNEGETLLVATDLLVGDVRDGICWIEGSWSRVVFALKRKDEDE